MKPDKYTILYTSNFINQFNGILKYFVHELKNKIAAESFYNEVIEKIEKRSKTPTSFEKYVGAKKRKHTYYKIYVKNFIIFYIVKDRKMEIRSILHSKRNFQKII